MTGRASLVSRIFGWEQLNDTINKNATSVIKPGCHYCVNACVTGAIEKIENFLFFMHTRPLRMHIRSKIHTSHGGFIHKLET